MRLLPHLLRTLPLLSHDHVRMHARNEGTDIITNLLAQRTVQTQLYYFQDFKNEFSTNWLQNLCTKYGTPKLLIHSQFYHAIDAFKNNIEFKTFFQELLRAKDETHEVKVTWGSRPTQGSPNNPYMKPVTEAKTYTDTIHPPQIARQLMSIRECIANEWVSDLRLIEYDNQELQRHHSEEVKHLVDDDERFRMAVRPVEISSEDGGPVSSTPLRFANFDLLKTAVTREAISRLAEELQESVVERHSAEWLQAFVRSHSDHFQGGYAATLGTKYGKARAFILEMMAQPVAVGMSLGGNPRFNDPLALADRLLEIRAEVATEWGSQMEQIPNEHLSLMRNRLAEVAVTAALESVTAQGPDNNT